MKNKKFYETIFGKKLYSAYRYIKDKKDVYEPAIPTILGFKFAGNEAMVSGQFEPNETKILKELVQRSEVFINIGANIGYYCCLALSCDKKVVAFEPLDKNLQYLFRNVIANGWEEKIEVYPTALSNKAGLISFYGEGTGASLVKGWANTPEDDVAVVACNTFDNVIGNKYAGRKCLILVDVEGAENLLLQGASIALKMHPKPTWMIEISITEHLASPGKVNPNLVETFDIFYSNGYIPRTADEQCRLVTREEILKIAKTGVDTIKVHNFIFSEADAINSLKNLNDS